MALKGKKLTEDYAVLSPKGESTIWTAEQFWKMAFNKKHPKNTRSMGYLVSAYEFDQDWDSWENHVNGDEFIFCVSGSLTFVLETTVKNKVKIEKQKLKAGEFFIVPKNTWHTAKITKKCKVLFVTWGYGTKHRSL